MSTREEVALLHADPFDIEAQKKVEAAIRQKGIDENWQAALEYNPKAFARLVMLYVDMEVNGVPLKSFVDSGAQSTIISKSCAERCGLLRLLDQRYKGIAHGVGQSEILGCIHAAPIKIGNIFYPCLFTVLDSPSTEFLFGLDMLRKHQCIIDLKENVLRVGGSEVSVPFLQEKDIPSRFLDEERYSKQASSSDAPVTSGTVQRSANAPSGGQYSGVSSAPGAQDFLDSSANMPMLLQELITEILRWLPVKSLVRFQGVSKLWRAVINELDFVKMHLQRSIETERERFFILQPWQSSTPHLRTYMSVELPPDDWLAEPLKVSQPLHLPVGLDPRDSSWCGSLLA